MLNAAYPSIIKLQFQMDMDLEALMSEFLDLQETKSNPLSERTLIELLLKVPSLGMVFYQTTDGNQYMTQQFLDSTILQTIKERGRVSSNELPQIIGINLDVIENRVNQLSNKQGFTKVDDRLMSPRYLVDLISRIQALIQQKGKMAIEQVSQYAELPVAFMRKLIGQQFQSLNCDLVKDVFVTREYRRRLRSQLTGILNGLLKPTGMSGLLKKLGVEDQSIREIVEDLIREEKVRGKVLHDYFVPQRFQQNQQALIEQWLQSNNYIEYSQLQKSFLISKPKQWVRSNLGAKVILLQESAFNAEAIQGSRTNLLSLTKQEGFAELSKVFPSFTENDIDILLKEHLNLPELVVSNGYCFDPAWLDDCCNAFREKIIYNLFFKSEDPKNKKKKKSRITLQDMRELLLEDDLVEYSVLQDLEETLYQLLNPRIDNLYKQCTTQLAQSKGMVTNNLLKYNKGKTILPLKDRCQKYLLSQEKQCKKAAKTWKDPEFGPTQEDVRGDLSILYYDRIPPKDWVIDSVDWVDVGSYSKGMQIGKMVSSKLMEKCKVRQVINLLDQFNKLHPGQIGFPFLVSEFEQFQQHGIHVFLFYPQNQQRYVIVDSLIPVVNGHPLGSIGSTPWVALVEKAFAKLRFCYKGILLLGISTIVQELTGLSQLAKLSSTNFKEGFQDFFGKILQLQTSSLVVGMTEGEYNQNIDLDGQHTGFQSNRVYLIGSAKRVQLEGDQQELFKISIKNGTHPSFLVRQDHQGDPWLQASHDTCILNASQLQAIFKTVYIFGRDSK